MFKHEFRAGSDLAFLLQDLQVRVPGNFPQRQHNARSQNLQLALQVRPAVQNFLRQRLVGWRRASHCCRDVRIFQLQAITSVQGSRLIRKTGFVQRCVEKISAAISCEDSSRAIRSMRRGSQAQNKKLRLRIAESRHGLAPIVPVAKRASLHARDFFAILHKSRALSARDDLIVQNVQCSSRVRHSSRCCAPSSFASNRYMASNRRTSIGKSVPKSSRWQCAALHPSQLA